MPSATARSKAPRPSIHEGLKAKGFTDEKLEAIEAGLGRLRHQVRLQPWTLGEEFLASLGITEAEIADPSFDLLGIARLLEEGHRGRQQLCLRAMTLEGAPGLKPEHLPVFDCANPCGKIGKRYLSVEATSA
jgi:ribonucleoside-diphosphate reductase alpha chain